MNTFNFDFSNKEPIKISVFDTVYYTKPRLDNNGDTIFCKIRFSIKGPEHVLTMVETFADADCYEAIGQANANPDDAFDFETGAQVARAKAESLAYAKVNKLFQRISDKMTDVMLSFLTFKDKAESVVAHNNEYLSTF
jgi:hypothetical protein